MDGIIEPRMMFIGQSLVWGCERPELPISESIVFPIAVLKIPLNEQPNDGEQAAQLGQNDANDKTSDHYP